MKWSDPSLETVSWGELKPCLLDKDGQRHFVCWQGDDVVLKPHAGKPDAELMLDFKKHWQLLGYEHQEK